MARTTNTKTTTNTVKKETIKETPVEENIVNTEEVVVEEKPVPVEVKPKTPRKFEPSDLIECRSMYAGTLLFTGMKTKITYKFSNIGDMAYIEYQDLRAALLTKKKSLTAPYIIIEDEDLLEEPHWKEIKKIYDGLYDKEDLSRLIDLPATDFKTNFEKLPIGFKNTVKTIVASQIEEGTFDSMNKAKIIDEICGTDLQMMMR